jgi:CheY-like chemotaxis protein
VFMDIEMPERNGLEVTVAIREYEVRKQHRQVPIVGLTGHGDKQTLDAGLEAGMNEMLTKPISKAKLRVILQTYAHT